MVKNLPDNARGVRDEGSIPGLGRCPGEWNGNSLQYFCLENFTERGAWWAIVHGAAKSRAQLSTRMMHCIPTEDSYLLHHFIWIKPDVVTFKEKIG